MSVISGSKGRVVPRPSGEKVRSGIVSGSKGRPVPRPKPDSVSSDTASHLEDK